MTDRKSMDNPARGVAAIMGFSLIALSMGLFAIFPDEAGAGSSGGGKRYSVAWSQTAAAPPGEAPLGGAGTETVVTVAITDKLASNVTISIPCVDTRPAEQVQAAAVVTYRLDLILTNPSGNESIPLIPPTSGSCPILPVTVVRSSHPDVGEVSASSEAGAQAAVWSGNDPANETARYMLTVSWTRGPGSLPAPLPGQAAPTLTGTARVEVQAWHATVNEKTEAGK